MQLLFGFKDVHLLDAYLDHFQTLGYKVDGATSLEELYALALKLKPACIISEYQLHGGADALSLHRELSAHLPTSQTKLILIADLPPELKLSAVRLAGMGIPSVIAYKNLTFETVESFL